VRLEFYEENECIDLEKIFIINKNEINDREENTSLNDNSSFIEVNFASQIIGTNRKLSSGKLGS